MTRHKKLKRWATKASAFFFCVSISIWEQVTVKIAHKKNKTVNMLPFIKLENVYFCKFVWIMDHFELKRFYFLKELCHIQLKIIVRNFKNILRGKNNYRTLWRRTIMTQIFLLHIYIFYIFLYLKTGFYFSISYCFYLSINCFKFDENLF